MHAFADNNLSRSQFTQILLVLTEVLKLDSGREVKGRSRWCQRQAGIGGGVGGRIRSWRQGDMIGGGGLSLTVCLCSFTLNVCDCDCDNNWFHRYMSHRMGTGPVGCNWTCNPHCCSRSYKHPLSHLHHDSSMTTKMTWFNDNGCRRYLSHKMGTGPIDCDWICKHPLLQLAHHSRKKGHFVTIFLCSS